MQQNRIDRINELAHKSKIMELTQSEKDEQSILRKEYIESFKANMKSTLDNIYVVDEQGNKKKLEPK